MYEIHHRSMAEILPIRRKTLSNQSINHPSSVVCPDALRNSELIIFQNMFSHNAEITLLTSIIKQYYHNILKWILTIIVLFHSFVLWKPAIIKIVWKWTIHHFKILLKIECSVILWHRKFLGVDVHHVELTHKKNPDGIHALFTEEHVGSVRVTRSK